jgi:cytochrome P450
LRTAPGPRGHVLLGKILQIRRDRLGFVTEIARQFGDVVRFRMGFKVLHLVSHPDCIRYVLEENHANYRKGVGVAQAKRWLGNGLVTSEGAAWARQRRLIQPIFNRNHAARFGVAVAEATSKMLEQWHSPAVGGRSLDVASHMMQLTLAIITRVVFDTVVSDAREVGNAFTVLLRDAMERMTATALLPWWVPLPGRTRFDAALATLHATVDHIIRERRARGDADSAGSALLSMLLAERETGAGGLSDLEIRDQVMTILLAGHETTASALAWTFHLLGIHPWAWDQVRDEVERVLSGRAPTPVDLPRLVWTRKVLEESLRLYPPVWLIPRQAIRADVIAGYRIPAGSEVLISPYVVHRHPSYWDQPDDFAPDRGGPDKAPTRSPYTFIPFGVGPRACVGSVFAMTEALMVIAMVAQRYRLVPVPGFPVEPEPLLTLRFRRGLLMSPVLF